MDREEAVSPRGSSLQATIAVPVYNGEAFLEECLSSALAQTEPVRVLVFDNASTDNSVAIARRLLPEESIIQQERNAGAIANFNRAVDAASTPWFAWLAADDRLRPSFVETCLRAAQAHEGAVACLSGIQYMDPHGTPLRAQSNLPLSSPLVGVRLRSILRRGRWTEVYCLYRTSVLAASPRFADEYGADVLLTWWFLLRHPFVVAPEPLLEYREYPAKSVGEMADALMPSKRPYQWLKVKMWRSMWDLASDPELSSATRRAARQELLLALTDRHAWRHLREDVVLYLLATGADLDLHPRATPMRLVVTTHRGWQAFRRRTRKSAVPSR